ncbi:MAG: DUF2238 domain-containing protein [Elusimicrobiota bacterium]|jgi:putative membrane protein|nr:DUF2238 domain-containing protein [Elusimicrobiota bacterium]
MTKYKIFLLVSFAAVWIWAACGPLYPQDWLLENYLTFVFIPVIFILGRYFKLSNVSYTLIAVFMILHTVGSHYSYSEVPFGETLKHWLNSDRNMYDRLVHFSFGLLMAYPTREVLIRVSKTKGFWSYYFPIDLVAALSALYEIIEWLSVQNVSAELGNSFLGMQGDVWDAQKDMLLAITGACLAMLIVSIINLTLDKKEFWKEFKESFKIEKYDKPLGEEKIAELLK